MKRLFNGSIQKLNEFSAKISAQRLYSGVIKLLNFIVRFITAHSKVIFHSSLTVVLAIAKGVISDSKIIEESVVKAEAAETATVSADSEIITESSFGSETMWAVWIDPVLENGILTIQSVYDATQTDEGIEVI